MKIKQSSLILILVLAAVLRLWKLDTVPPSLTPDEAAIGYNAYSILKTGRDEYGTLLPVIFKSFGDFKPGLYIYATIPPIALLGLNEFSVRLSSSVAGVITVYLVYLIAKELFKDPRIGVFAGLVLAVCPWHIYFSRGAWEVNLALTLTLAGIYFFLKSLVKQKYLVFSVLFFALTLITYQGAKLSTGIVVAILLILYRKEFLTIDRKTIVKSAILGLIVILPIILSLFSRQAGRLGVFSVFSYPRPEKYLQDFLDQGQETKNSLNYYLFHSENVNFLRGVLGRYFNHFSGKFLFFEGDWANPRHSAPNHGMLLLGDLVLVITGAIAVVRKKLNREQVFVLLWLFLAPLPAVLSRDQVHAVRALNMVIPVVIIMALGINWLVKYKKWSLVILGGYLLSFIYFLDAYFVHLPAHDSKYWEYGYKQIVETVAPIKNNYKTVKVQQSYAQPYIYFLFYEKYDPARYQQIAKLKESSVGDVGQVESLDNISFEGIDWSRNRGEHGVLFVADPIRIPPEDSKNENEFKLIREIKYLNGRDTAFRIIEVK